MKQLSEELRTAAEVVMIKRLSVEEMAHMAQRLESENAELRERANKAEHGHDACIKVCDKLRDINAELREKLAEAEAELSRLKSQPEVEMKDYCELWLMWSDLGGEYCVGFEDTDAFFFSRDECQLECDDANATYKTKNEWRPVRVPAPDELTRLRRDSEALGRVREVAAHHRQRIECWVGRVPTARAVIETIESAIAGEGES